MASRIIVFDTETTGLSPEQGHCIIEIGCVELLNYRPTNNYFHCYLRPNRPVDPEAFAVHGISDEFLADKPTFAEILRDFLAYLHGADELVAHNMSFDQSFVDEELRRVNAGFTLKERFILTDTLAIARQKFPGGQKNSLDALCKRFSIDNSARDLHGALLDAKLLAEVYLQLTTDQTNFDFSPRDPAHKDSTQQRILPDLAGTWRAATLSAEEKAAHDALLSTLRP